MFSKCLVFSRCMVIFKTFNNYFRILIFILIYKMLENLNSGYTFYHKTLSSPKFILAPMVDQSEYAFRELCRMYDIHLAYTPMMNSSIFVNNSKYRDFHLYKCSFDRPLIAQFCSNDVAIFTKACELAKDYCDGIDLNLGCPQAIAKKGNYGSFLQDEWSLIEKMIKSAIKNVNIPITCKIRIFEDEAKTIEYAKMLEKAGCFILTVHGRTREMKGHNTGLADWNIIKKIKENVSIPVFANGNIQSFLDVENCFKMTKVDGIMSAEGLLHNPALFKSVHIPTWQIIRQYLDLAKKFPCPNSYIRGHLFKISHHTLILDEYSDLRNLLAKAQKFEQFEQFSELLKIKFEIKDENQVIEMNTFPLPHYVCQPYFRPKPQDCNVSNEIKKKLNQIDENFDKNNLKKKIKLDCEDKIKFVNCNQCLNPKSLSCEHSLCRKCCKIKCSNKLKTCAGHHFV